MAFEYKVILHFEKITPRLIASLLTVSTIRASEVIQIGLLASKEHKARGYKLDVLYINKRTHLARSTLLSIVAPRLPIVKTPPKNSADSIVTSEPGSKISAP